MYTYWKVKGFVKNTASRKIVTASFSTLKIKKECLFLNRHTKSKVWGDYRNGEPSAHDEQKGGGGFLYPR